MTVIKLFSIISYFSICIHEPGSGGDVSLGYWRPNIDVVNNFALSRTFHCVNNDCLVNSINNVQRQINFDRNYLTECQGAAIGLYFLLKTSVFIYALMSDSKKKRDQDLEDSGSSRSGRRDKKRDRDDLSASEDKSSSKKSRDKEDKDNKDKDKDKDKKDKDREEKNKDKDKDKKDKDKDKDKKDKDKKDKKDVRSLF